MISWHKFAVYCGYLAKPANPDQYYCHHPYGTSALDAIFYVVLGHHWFTARAAAIFCAVISPPMIYGFGRRAWGVIPASCATMFFSFVPIDLSFSNFGNLEEPTIAFGLMFGWATAALWETWKTRYIVFSAIGALGCANGDWAGLVFLGPVLAFAFVRAYVLPRRWYGRIDDRRYAQWFAYGVVMAAGTLVAYLYLFGKADKIGDMMGSYHLRASGSETPVEETFNQRRKMWLGIMLTPISYGAMAAGLPLALVRVTKKPLEIFSIAWFIGASFQYFVFKQAADIHIFWPHYYAPTAALAAGTLVATFVEGYRALVELVREKATRPWVLPAIRWGVGGALGLAFGIPLFLLVRIGIPELVQSRKTAGRFDQGGHYISTDADMADFAKWAYEDVATAGSTAQVLERYDYNFSSEYGGNRPYVRVNNLTAAKPDDVQRIALVDTRNQPEKEIENIAKQFAIQAVGPLWRVDRAKKGPDLIALRYEEREPRFFEWMFVAGTDLVRKISRTEDPWRTWELRDALGLPAPVPAGVAVSVDEKRIAHNAAVSQQDTGRARDLEAELGGNVGRPLGIKYTDGIELQGIDVQDGPAIVVTLFWSTDGSFKKQDVNYQLKCKIVAPPRLWKTSLDYFEKEMMPVPIIRPASWKPGYLYTQRFIALHRIGKEECRGAFNGDVHPVSGEPNPIIVTFD
jgi:hypothetical protein